jgi:glycosyltransferase involved in cell wall biosynthesis
MKTQIFPTDPRVSVIIPTFNRGWAVKRAIDSVLGQTFKNFELIVVDDGSDDDTSDLLQKYDARIVVIRQPNKGVSAARNLGILNAGGELISFLDSDDLWLPEKLSRQTAFFDHYPEALICQTEEIWIRNNKRVNSKKRHQKPEGMIFEQSLALCLVSPSAVMVRKKLLDEVGLFDEELPACEDYDLWLRIAWKYPVYRLDEALIVKYGGHADQLSRAPELDKFRIAALLKIIDSGNLDLHQHESAVKMLTHKCRIYAGGCLKRGKHEIARYYTTLAEERIKSSCRMQSP